MSSDSTSQVFWQIFTRLGESEILLPITIGLAVWLSSAPARCRSCRGGS